MKEQSPWYADTSIDFVSSGPPSGTTAWRRWAVLFVLSLVVVTATFALRKVHALAGHSGTALALSAAMTIDESDSSSDLLKGIHYYAMVLLLTDRHRQPFKITSIKLVGVPAEFKVVPTIEQPSARIVLGMRADCSAAQTLPAATVVNVKVHLSDGSVASQMVPLSDWRAAVGIIRRSACR